MGESLWSKVPDYRLVLEPSREHICVRFAGTVVAETDRPLIVREADYPPVVYFPPEDVDFSCLEPSTHTTFCPFKGDASYWSLRVGDAREDDAVWCYAEPFEPVAALAGHLAFYADRVEWQREG